MLSMLFFGNGPMTPTLLDVIMLTGLNISKDDRPFDTVIETNHLLVTKGVGGWKGYIAKHAKTGTIDNREHIAFLNMWLEKFIFCGSTCGPPTNMQLMAERPISGQIIPLGKHLLGAVYLLLHQVSTKLATNQLISNIGGPWWFIQLWLNMYIHKAIGKEITKPNFPADHLEDDDAQRHRCSSFGEAASAMPWQKLHPAKASIYFTRALPAKQLYGMHMRKMPIISNGHSSFNLQRYAKRTIPIRKNSK
jgi:hypothetical protein